MPDRKDMKYVKRGIICDHCQKTQEYDTMIGDGDSTHFSDWIELYRGKMKKHFCKYECAIHWLKEMDDGLRTE